MALVSYALTTVQRAKDFLGVSGTSHDTTIERIVNSTTDWIERYCDRRFKETTYSNELYDGSGSAVLMLNQLPINESETFTLERRDTTTNQSSFSTINSELYFVNFSAGYIDLVGSEHLSFTETDRFARVPKHYRISYTAGYDYDNSTTFLSSTEAGDLEYAAWKLIGAAFFQRTNSGNVQSERIGDYDVTFTKEVAMDDEVKSILSRFRRLPG